MQNILFNYIKSEQENLNKFFDSQNITIIDSKRYFLIELPGSSLEFKTEDQTYNLTGHHISFYATKSKKPTLSEYHYTAYFHDKNGKNYRLHVYLDHNDKKTLPPVFSIHDNVTNDYLNIDCKELVEDYLSLALSKTGPIITELRKKLNDKVQQLDNNYKTAERNACNISAALPINYKNYLKSLNKVQIHLEKLIPLTVKSHYGSSLAAIIRLQNYVNEKIIEEENQTVVAQRKKLPKPIKEANIPIQPQQPSSNQPYRFIQSPYAIRFEELNNSFSAFESVDFTEKFAFLESLSQKSKDLILDIEMEKKPNKDILIKITNLQTIIKMNGEELFNTSIQKRNFTYASQLSSFCYLLSTQHLTKALQSRDIELLDFVTKYSGISLNTAITVRGKNYSSAVFYCYSENSGNKPMVNCLTTLLNNGASIHVRNAENLPVAYVILSSPNHPLRPALSELISSNPVPFYKRLIADLNDCIVNNQLTEDERLKMTLAKKKYFLKINNTYNTYLDMIFIDNPERIKELIDNSSKEEVERTMPLMYLDVEIIKMGALAYEAFENYKKMLPVNVHVNFNNIVKDILTNAPFDIPSAGPTFKDDLKKEIINTYTNIIKIINIQTQLLDVRQQLKRPTKKTKKLLKIEEQLMGEYERLASDGGDLNQYANQLEKAKKSLQKIKKFAEDGINLNDKDFKHHAQLLLAEMSKTKIPELPREFQLAPVTSAQLLTDHSALFTKPVTQKNNEKVVEDFQNDDNTITKPRRK